MIEKIIVAVLAGIFCSMASTLIAIALAPKFLKGVVKEEIQHHEEVHHRYSVKEQIEKHADNCFANVTIGEIRDAVMWLVVKLDGDPEKLGLTNKSKK